MRKLAIGRRTVLRAAGQAAITLPFLEIMNEEKARAAVAPRRYVVMSAGTSLCRNGQNFAFWAPKGGGGRNYPITRDLAPLGTSNSWNRFGNYGVQDQVSVVSGLRVPWV